MTSGKTHRLHFPIDAGTARTLRAGDSVVLDGEITITAFDLGFEPAMAQVSAPGTYTVNFTNEGGTYHDLTFADGTITRIVRDEKAGLLRAGPLPPGVYRVEVCADPACSRVLNRFGDVTVTAHTVTVLPSGP